MADRESPYVNRCAFCEEGLLRLHRCAGCGTIAAICDECELMWSDVPAVSQDASAPADGTFPSCQKCELDKVTWSRLDPDEIKQAQLDDCIAGRSV
jgi:hypothetical protein